VTVDQWGELLSGYAPIRSGTTGEAVAVLGVDMDAAEFRAYTRSILSPFALVLILALTVTLSVGVALLIESRQLSALARVNAERSGLLQLTFHQLGEPITILQWGIETLEDSKDDVDSLRKVLPDNLADMREGVRRLGSIIDTLQEAEKVELRAFENKPVEQSAKAFLEGAIDVIVPPSPDRAGRVAIDAADAKFSFDPHLLTIILRRLVENALEFSPQGSLVRVRAEAEGKWLRIEVADAGCGIPEKDLPHLFEKYRRASNASTMKPDGNGLGLYIVRGILEIMGGDIRVDTVEGKGTTVTIRVPSLAPKGA
jgi:two-component system sensor histidine kinase BaeS